MGFEPKSEYARKLLDPRWQRKRLQILQRDGFTCQVCGDTKTTLHVHHKAYRSGSAPWEYPSDWLVTLCAPCHEAETDQMNDVIHDVVQELKLVFTAEEIGQFVVALHHLREHRDKDTTSIIRYHLESAERYAKLKKAYVAHRNRRKRGGQ